MRFFALVVALLLWLPSAVCAESLRVVALPIVVHSSESDPRYVSEGLADMLSSRLEQLRGVRVVSTGESGPATLKLEEALALGREARGDYVIFGAFTQFGEGASLDVQCVPLHEPSLERTLAARRIFVQSGAVGEIIPKLDEMVDRIAFYLHRRPDEAGAEKVRSTLLDPVPADRAEGVGGSGMEALRDRVEALERAVYGPPSNAASGEVAEKLAGPPEP